MEIEDVTPRRLLQASMLRLPLNVSDVSAPLPVLAAGLSTEVKAGLVGALENNNKLQSLAGQHSDVLENSTSKVRKRKRIELLREIQRYEIVNGVVEVESVAKENAEETKTDDKGLPGFWLTAMKNNDVLTEKIEKRDEKALKFLKDRY